MRLLLLCIAVCLAPTFGQTPNAGSGAPSTGPASTKQTTKPALTIKPALKIVPAKPANPSGLPNVPPPRASPPRSRGMGIFNAPVQSPWGIPPPQQQKPSWGMPQTYPSPNLSPSFQPAPRWGRQPQPNPFQSMPWLRMQNMNVLLDRMDVPCGMSRRRQQMFMHAVDHPDPFCECRIGGCDGGVHDFTGQTECGAFGAMCCCTGTPYSSLVTATLLSGVGQGQGQGPFNPYANPFQRNRMGMQPQGMGRQQQFMGRQPQGMGRQPQGMGRQAQGLGRQQQGYVPVQAPSPMMMSHAQMQQPSTMQDFRSMWLQ